MSKGNRAYIEHVAFKVKDIDWHLNFFREVLDMDVRRAIGDDVTERRQVWTVGGAQLMSDPSFEGPEGRLAHLGVMVEDQAAVLQKAKAFGVTHLPMGENWLVLPDGLCVEILQARNDAVGRALAIDPRA